MEGPESTAERTRVYFAPRGRRAWCAGAMRPPNEARPGASGWTAFFRIPEALRKRRVESAEEPEEPRAPLAKPERAQGEESRTPDSADRLVDEFDAAQPRDDSPSTSELR